MVALVSDSMGSDSRLRIIYLGGLSMNSIRLVDCRALLLAATSLAGAFTASPATAQNSLPADAVEGADLQIVTNDTVTPGPGSAATGANYANSTQVLSTGVNGVGQQIAFIPNATQTGAGLSLCSGTLINPRTVITAAHCLYSIPAANYGSNTGAAGGINPGTPVGNVFGSTAGVPLSFGFNSTNRCTGTPANPVTGAPANPGNGCLAGTGAYEVWRDSGFQTSVAMNIFNANQVWYGRNSQPVFLGGGGEFANGDIALVTLDTHAQGIPTWTLLFSPLDGPTHATITGYGGAGVGLAGIGSLAGIDYRRRSAENMIDALMSRRDWTLTPAIGGPGSTANATQLHAIYWTDFDDPNWNPTTPPANFFVNTAGPAPARNNGYYDFNVFGGVTLPLEGSTAGGDSGGPLIVDQRWDRAVIAGVLTGSLSFNGGISTYGQMNVYPPLFNFWEDIVQNNPYKYVSALAGDGDWLDPTHWVQDMDPNYVVIGADGQLVNAVPDTVQGGGDGNVQRYGLVCFYGQSCSNVTSGSTPVGDGTQIITAGGPGTINFVPNNIEPVNSATAALNVRARYYDVTLREAGRTTLNGSATIDKLTIDGAARLNIAATGNLSVWAEYNQLSGWTNIDGRLKTGEALIVSGLLTGRGTFDPTFLTVVGGIVAPGGGDQVGTLTVQGDVILASASSLFIDARRGSADLLNVTADAQNAGILALSNGALVFNKVTDAPAPRHGESYIIASAAGGVFGTFGQVYTFQGVLRPHLTYGTNTVTALLRAGSLVTILDGQNATAIAFATALDALRSTSYNQLYNLYGAIDWMGGTQLSASLSALSPRIIGETQQLQDRQSKTLMSTIGDRLSLLGTGRATGISMFSARPLAPLSGNPAGTSASQRLGLSSTGTGGTVVPIAGGITGFVTGGLDQAQASYGDQDPERAGQRGSHGGFGLEIKVGHKASIGTAVGFAKGRSNANADSGVSRMQQAAAYGAYSLGRGAYVGAVLAAETASADLNRIGHDGVTALSLSGATRSVRYSAMAEAGWRKAIGGGLALTPRAQLGYSHYSLGGFGEKGGETALQLDSLKVNRLDARVGVKLDGTAKLGAWSIRPQLQADYVRLVQAGGNGAMVRFAAAPDVAFALPLTSAGTGWSEMRGGVEMSRGAFTLGLNGQATVGDAPLADQRGAVDLTVRF